jgi:hypothetical protein
MQGRASTSQENNIPASPAPLQKAGAGEKPVPRCCWKGASAAMQRAMFRHFRGLGWGSRVLPRSRRLRLKRAAFKPSTDADLAFADDTSAPTAIKSVPPGTTDAPAVITVLPPGSIDGPSAATEAQAVATHGSHAVASALLVSPAGSTDGPSATADAPAVATDGPHVTASAPLAAEGLLACLQFNLMAAACDWRPPDVLDFHPLCCRWN